MSRRTGACGWGRNTGDASVRRASVVRLSPHRPRRRRRAPPRSQSLLTLLAVRHSWPAPITLPSLPAPGSLGSHMAAHSSLPRRPSALGMSAPSTPVSDVYHRQYPTVRTSTASTISLDDAPGSPVSGSSPRLSATLLPLETTTLPSIKSPLSATGNGAGSESGPTVCGLPLKYVS